MRRPGMRRLLATAAALIALAAFGTTPAAADHEGDPFVGDIVLNIPDTFASCLDEALFIDITTTGTGTRTLQGQIIVDFVTDAGREQVPGGFYPVDQVGDLNVTITIPPVSEWPVLANGTAEIHVDVQLGVFDENGVHLGNIGPGHDFDIFCLDPPPPPPPTGDDGCTPGYWKNHLDAWEATGYVPDDSFSTVFGVTATGNPTLLQAANTGGGGESALLRHATAALLNAASPDVDYAYTVAEVIAMVQNAYATGDFEATKDLFDIANNAGCPL